MSHSHRERSDMLRLQDIRRKASFDSMALGVAMML